MLLTSTNSLHFPKVPDLENKIKKIITEQQDTKNWWLHYKSDWWGDSLSFDSATVYISEIASASGAQGSSVGPFIYPLHSTGLTLGDFSWSNQHSN